MSPINPHKLKLSQLRALATVAEQGNFGAAALVLGISQSAISHAIASLENELGVILLSRGRHGATLTPVGDRILAKVYPILQSLEELVQEADLAKGLQGGKVRIASFRSIATHVLPVAISKFHEKVPNGSVTVSELDELCDIEQALQRGQADIGFTHLPTSEEFDTWEVLKDEYIVVLPPNAPHRGQLTWQQLAQYPLIISSVGSCSRLIHDNLAQADCPQQVRYEMRGDSTILSMVMQGLGASILPHLAAEPLPPGSKVCRLPVPFYRIIGAAMHSEALHPPAVYAFWDVLKAVNLTALSPANSSLTEVA
ncbi:MAG: LysR family transcriptional regulator [Jaaginema sp. PMC 1079.18]|nr:LysR family transcriptional regulator [Jaaginema sp. PMC 1080.18]MEC4853776.1 LysR family transcriptional regulator [Jaaginema sp. PMC 1079.18]MEC4869090.1 LysR family transcriptional regulator [Jaaginema sp. PMC 1078.18]